MILFHYQQFLFIFITIIKTSFAFWWSLGLPSFQIWPTLPTSNEPWEQNQFCSSLTFLTFEQRSLCQTNPKIFSIIHRSLRMAIDECQYQFRNQRWNCSLFNQPEILGKLFLRKTPETAFIYALTSAAVMHNIAKACARNELNECTCDKNQPETTKLIRIKDLSSTTPSSLNNIVPSVPNDGFEWSGCSDNLRFGRNISVSFIDKQEMSITRRRVVRLVNLHNNEAGRQSVERNVQLTCKCHGVSGSCTLRVCWRTLPDFRIIGSELRTKYESATQIRYNTRLNILKPRKTSQKLFNGTDLVHIHLSPSFCERNLKLGSLGTKGRQCNLTNSGPGSCSILCCDRGYETIVSKVEEDCDCQFHWCCEIRCKRCVRQVEKHFCK